jgi:hypothetical protein
VILEKLFFTNCLISISNIEYLFPIGTSGFGIRVVKGLKRVPIPPAKIIALIDLILI